MIRYGVFPMVFSYDLHILNPVGLQRTSGDGSCGMDQSQRQGGKISFLQELCSFRILSQAPFIILFLGFSKVFHSPLSFFFDYYIVTTCHHCNIMSFSCSPILWSFCSPVQVWPSARCFVLGSQDLLGEDGSVCLD